MDDREHGRVVRVNSGDDWDWQAEWQAPRPGIPVFGIFLILLGLYLAIGEITPLATQVASSIFFLAIGLLLLVRWLRDGSHLALYAGAFLTALSLAGLLSGLSVIKGDGWGTLFLGIAALLIAAVRAARGGGWGWQAVVGVVFVLLGGTEVGSAYLSFDLNRLALPILIVLLGLLVIWRARPAGMR